MGWARVAFGFGLGLAFACQSSGQAFECTTNDQCGADGTCQPTGFCSFPDTTCPSEQRYGSLAGDRLADTCVPENDSSTSDGSTSSVAMTAGSGSTTSTTSIGSVGPGPGSASVGSSFDSSSGTDETGGPDPLGPVVWYRFDQVEGGVIPDASGNGIDGSCASCGAVVTGALDSGVEFREVENIVLADHHPALENNQVTVAAWISLYSQACMSIASKPIGGADANSWQLYTCNNMRGGMDLVGYISGVRDHFFVATYDAPAEGEFIHVAMTFSGEIIRLYVNAEQRLSMQLEHELAFDDSPLIVGGEDNGEGLTFPFQGVIDDLRVYTRALTAEEMAELFAER